ncbi:MAG: chemotaxis protein CheA, partial [Proteobacteria bacterium]|nr:chemotaxis protein CheA [Pseudomonadota bacterium]
MDDADFELNLKRTFIDEAILNLEEAESCFMELETALDPKPLLNKIFRVAHNLKGGSRSVGFGDVAEFTHELESLVLAIQNSKVALSTEVVSTLLLSNDWLVEMMAGLKSDISANFSNPFLLAEVRAWINGNGPSSPDQKPTSMAPEAGHFFEDFSTPKMEVEEPLLIISNDPQEHLQSTSKPIQDHHLAANKVPPLPTKSQKSEKDDEVVRVSISRIDLLNDYIGELMVLQTVIQQQSRKNDAIKLDASIRQMIKLSKEIQSLSMRLRMLPVKPLVQKLQRVVRDTATALGKSAVLELVGDHIDADKSVLDRLSDPLIHVLRNAVDHGIETPEGRALAGKRPQGKVSLSFQNEGNYLIIQVSDDGKGINASVLRKKAIERKIITETETLSEKQLVNLIFHPGFSTKEVTTEVSGRGVGMDVVKTNIDLIGGQVEVTTEVGKGSNFRIKIPLSLAVIEGLVTSTGISRYVIPLNQVQETVNLGAVKHYPNKLGIGDCIEIRGQCVPLYRLTSLIDPSKPSDKGIDSTALLFLVGNTLAAVSIRDLLHSQQVVIKPLAN